METFGKSQRIVIVEDNASLAEIYKTRLELLGYECFIAADGTSAVDIIKDKKPNLVLLDIILPDISGGDVLSVMRANDWGKNIPVYVISNLNETEAPQNLRGLGIEGYAVKANLSNDQLDQLVDAILKPAAQQEDVSLEN